MSTIEKVDALITYIDSNIMNQNNNNNNNDSDLKQDESKNECDSNIIVLGMGNPLLDISSPVNPDFMKKYDIRPNNAILATDKHLPMYKELTDMSTVEYIGGGSTLNSMRVCQWMLDNNNNNQNNKQSLVGYFGCIGNDKYGEILEQCCINAGLDCCFMKTDKVPTGTCAVCITDKERSLVANLSAANEFKINHILENKKTKLMLSKCKLIYSAGFFLTVSPDSMLYVAKECNNKKIPYCINLSAEFIVQFFGEPLLKLLPLVNYIFSNETEAKAFAKANNIQFKDMQELALNITKFKNDNNIQRTVIITQGKDPVIVASSNNKVKSYPVSLIPAEKIVDANGAGDGFVGGFLSQLVQGKNEEICVAAGNYAAQYIIQRAGTTLDGKPEFKQ